MPPRAPGSHREMRHVSGPIRADRSPVAQVTRQPIWSTLPRSGKVWSSARPWKFLPCKLDIAAFLPWPAWGGRPLQSAVSARLSTREIVWRQGHTTCTYVARWTMYTAADNTPRNFEEATWTEPPVIAERRSCARRRISDASSAGDPAVPCARMRSNQSRTAHPVRPSFSSPPGRGLTRCSTDPRPPPSGPWGDGRGAATRSRQAIRAACRTPGRRAASRRRGPPSRRSTSRRTAPPASTA